MSGLLEKYNDVVGEDVIGQLRELADNVGEISVVHVNSTKYGGGVAEILAKLVPMMNELGIRTSWEVIEGDEDFYQTTKSFHNALQGNIVEIPDAMLRNYERINERNAEALRDKLESADIVFIHDPQPAPLLKMTPKRKGKWVWRCHIDASRPFRPVWKYLRNFVVEYDASIFSLANFAQNLPHMQFLIPPSIDPISDKNIELPANEIKSVYKEFGIDPERPLISQISRFDRFKDPVGVIWAYKIAKKFLPGLQLILAGGDAADDPEGAAVIEEVRMAECGDPDIHILLLPPDAHRKINAIQRASDLVLQKSIREGFGLTVAEALWKHKAVIGGNTGGIRLQIFNHHTGFLVDSPEGAALRIRYLLFNRDILRQMGEKGHHFVKNNFLITRHLREYLTVILSLLHSEFSRIVIG
ncbi:MAG TPA: glycosyltransferase [candidate division Zixibacteria bacterium]|nr:glycosyltransferase [candidate division Zixibacteria bacterium]